MSKKTLNKENLAALGAERLASLLIEVSTGSAEIKRRLRLEISHNLGAEELARDVRKRLVSIRRSTSYVGWRRRKALIKDLSTQAEMITKKIALEAPAEAFDLLWHFVELAPSVYARVDDSRGDVGEVFRDALAQFAVIGPMAGADPQALAGRVWDALRDNTYGEFDGIIGLLASTMGDEGLEHLKSLVLDHKAKPAEDTHDHEALQFLRNLRSTSGNHIADQKSRLIRLHLQEIATAQGDIDAYIAQFSAKDLKRPLIAAKAANLLLADFRPEQALELLSSANESGGADAVQQWSASYIACLLALDRNEDAQQHRWECFQATLDVQMLRDHLKVLPDFDDIEVEDNAMADALEFENMSKALMFFLEWPDLGFAARLIETRAEELDGDLDQILTAAAEGLRNRHPLAAVLVWRAMIDHALGEGRSSRYGDIANLVMECAAADAEIVDYGRFRTHQEYVFALRELHKHRKSFWARIP